MAKKTCTVCGVEKQTDQFQLRYVNENQEPIYRNNCKACRNVLDQKYRERIRRWANAQYAETKRLAELGRKYEAMLKDTT